jgi:hypothetical protein
MAVCKTSVTNRNSSEDNIVSPETALGGMLYLHGMRHHSQFVAHCLVHSSCVERRHEHHHQGLGLMLNS